MTELYGIVSLGGTVVGASLNQRGLKGETGDKGDKGDAATIAVGSTSTSAAGTNASVTNSGTQYAAVFDFTIPKGDKGETGDVNTYIAEYGTASYADIGDAITEGKYVIAVKDDNYYPLIMFSNSSYVFSYIHENICHEVVCDSYSTWTARTHTSVRDVKQNGASVTTSGVALVTTPQPTTTTPKMDGTAAVGSETTWAKGDHVHPSDTTKVDKVAGKGLSENDFTDSLKTKLDGIASGAEVNVQSDWNQSTNTADDYIKNKPDLSVYAPLASPSLTGTPTAPTATEGTNTTQIATTAFVKTADDAVKGMLKDALPTETASGAIASFPDGSDLFDYLSCVADIDPIQDLSHGAPSPSNICPISGHDEVEVGVVGKNWIPNGSADATSRGITFTRNADGTITASGTATGGNSFFTLCDEYPMKAGNYYISGGISDAVQLIIRHETVGGAQIAVSSGSQTFFTLTEDENVGVIYRIVAGTTINEKMYPMVRISSADADFEPYTGQSYNTQLGQTVYGGTLDVVSGVLTVTHANVDMGDINWTLNSGTNRASSTDLMGLAKMTPINVPANMIAEQYVAIPANTSLTLGTMAFFTAGSYDYLYLYYDGVNAPSGNLCYELATPQTYQLTPQQIQTLVGQNNVWADCGNVEVQYKADVQMYIEKHITVYNGGVS